MSKSSNKSSVYADIPKNRLYIILRGPGSSSDIDNIYTDIRFSVADLKEGFSVITDMTEAKIAQLAGIATFKKISRFLLDNEVRTVVRVIDNPGIIVKQLVRLTELIQGYRPVYVKSRAEAERLLDEAEEILEKAL